jgi:hypothetical protein
MKYYIYYATEENGYETEKHASENPIEDIKEFLKEDGFDEEEIGEIAGEMTAYYSTNGYAYETLVNGQGYEIVIGLAQHGKCSNITSVIADCRREMRY